MGIYAGSQEVVTIHAGSKPVKEVYKGSTLIWPLLPANPVIYLDQAELYQDGDGIVTPVNAGQPVGYAVDQSGNAVRGANEFVDPNIVGSPGWVDNGDGTFTKAATGGAALGINTGPDIGFYEISGVVTESNGNGFAAHRRNQDDTANEFVVSLPSFGTFRFIVMVRPSAQSRTIWFDGSDFTGTLQNLQFRKIAGYSFFQDVNDDRPVLGRHPTSGIRNLFDSADTSGYGSSNMTSIPNAALTADGVMEAAVLSESVDASPQTHRSIGPAFAGLPDNVEGTISLYIKSLDAERTIFRLYVYDRGDSGNYFRQDFDLASGTLDFAISNGGGVLSDSGIEDVGGGYYRIWATGTANTNGTGGDVNPQVRVEATTGSTNYQGDGRDVCAQYGLQIEVGPLTPQQVRVSQYDITEPGFDDVWYFGQTVPENLSTELPDLGANVTEFWADENGVTINSGVTVGAGVKVMQQSERVYAYGMYDRALNAAEDAQLRRILMNKAGT